MFVCLIVVSFPRLCEDGAGKADTDICITSRTKTVGFGVPTKSQLLFVPVAPETSPSLCLLFASLPSTVVSCFPPVFSFALSALLTQLQLPDYFSC